MYGEWVVQKHYNIQTQKNGDLNMDENKFTIINEAIDKGIDTTPVKTDPFYDYQSIGATILQILGLQDKKYKSFFTKILNGIIPKDDNIINYMKDVNLEFFWEPYSKDSTTKYNAIIETIDKKIQDSKEISGIQGGGKTRRKRPYLLN